MTHKADFASDETRQEHKTLQLDESNEYILNFACLGHLDRLCVGTTAEGQTGAGLT